MHDILLQGWEILINGLEAFLFFILISKKCEAKKQITFRNKKIFLFLFLKVILLYLFNKNGVSLLITISFFNIIHFIFIYLFYSSTLFTRLFWIVIYTILTMLSDMITSIIPTTLASVNVRNILTGGYFRIPMTLTYIALLSLFVFLIIIFTDNKLFFSLRQKITFVALSFSSMAVAQYIFIITIESATDIHTKKIANSLGLVCFLFITLFLALLFFVYQLGISKQKNIIYLEEKQKLELEQKQFQNIIDSTQALRTMKHDMSIHLDIIDEMVHSKNFEKLATYIANYQNHLDEAHHLLSTGNTAIDCIVSSKIAIAHRKDIRVTYSVLLPDKLPLDDVSLCSLIGNILSNAIEACEKLPVAKDNPRWIQFTIQPYQTMLGIHIKNSTNGHYTLDFDDNLVSTKGLSKHNIYPAHGLGLKRVKELVAMADGLLDYELEKDYFDLHIMLPLKEIKENDI